MDKNRVKIGSVIGLQVAPVRGIEKSAVDEISLKEDWGIEGDAHAGHWNRQVSIFPIEALMGVPWARLKTMQDCGRTENITICGIALEELKEGRILVARDARIKILSIGKCPFKEDGRSYIVSRQARFGVVLQSGKIRIGDCCLLYGK